MAACGIDFGTSNSSIGLATKDQVTLVAVENDHITIPSALFYPRRGAPAFGRAAADLFFQKTEGRYMRSLKRVLGTSLMKLGTSINGRPTKFEQIIAAFIQYIRQQGNHAADHEITQVVMGRPVHFVDNDPASDARAQQELEHIANTVGFKDVSFQFEPIAAAFAHEANLAGEKLAIVADLGGGTSDFTIIKLSKDYTAKTDRSNDILANTGVRIGGNDFDKKLSLAAVMPALGYKTTYGDKQLEVPIKLYHDLAEWSKVNQLYTPKIITQTRQLLHQAHDKTRFKRILTVLEKESGHAVLAATENAKIGLTNQDLHPAYLQFLEPDLNIPIHRQVFEEAIQEDVQKIEAAARACVTDAGVKHQDINLIILTGGSTEVPLVQRVFKNLFPHATLSDEQKLSSVGLGLAHESKRRYT